MYGDEYIMLCEIGVPDIPLQLLTNSKVNLTNLHTGMWALLNLYKEETDDNVFKDAMCALDEGVTPDILYDILAADLPYYNTDVENMRSYASKINTINREMTKKRNAK